MPRIHPNGLVPLDVYDTIFDRLDSCSSSAADLAGGSVRIFGNRNIGDHNLTNLQVGGQILHGAAYVRRMYATTNIPIYFRELQVFQDFAYATMVRLNVGCRSTSLQASLAQLLEGGQLPDTEAEERQRLLFEMEAEAIRLGLQEFQRATQGRMALSDLPQDIQRGWTAAARAIWQLANGSAHIIIPVRQCYDVCIATSPSAFDSMRRAATEGQQELCVRPMIRIHLQGVAWSEDR